MICVWLAIQQNNITTDVTRFRISINHLKIGREIGRGKYGRVCSGVWGNINVALKFCKERDNIEDFIKEVKIVMYKYSSLSPHFSFLF
jgi:predicted Ser/Thr protein kinase